MTLNPDKELAHSDDEKTEWLSRLSDLVDRIEQWSKELGWSTRRIEKQIEEAAFGRYRAPGLLMQAEAIKILLDPIARFAPGADGIVDLYLLPAYDDIASLYFYDDDWHVHYAFPNESAITKPKSAEAHALSKDSLGRVLNEMKQHAA